MNRQPRKPDHYGKEHGMNSSIMHARSLDAIRPRSNDERRAQWAARYFAQGHHRTPQKPRVRPQVRPQH